MKKITLNNKKYVLVEVPAGAYDFIILSNGIYFTLQYFISGVLQTELNFAPFSESEQFSVVGKISNIINNEDICKELVELDCAKDWSMGYFDYATVNKSWYGNPCNSFLSYLKSINLDMTKEYSLIRTL